jgi:hypothetical protein
MNVDDGRVSEDTDLLLVIRRESQPSAAFEAMVAHLWRMSSRDRPMHCASRERI